MSDKKLNHLEVSTGIEEDVEKKVKNKKKQEELEAKESEKTPDYDPLVTKIKENIGLK